MESFLVDLYLVDCYAEIYLEFPNFPKNIDEMKIARYLLQQIFNSTFEYVNFSDFIFNPQIIELLFDEGKTKIPLQIHSKRARLYIRNKIDEYFYKFILNYLVVSHELILTLKRHTKKEHINNLFKFLTNGGNRFSYVYCEFHDLKLINLFIQYIETSKNISKMVKKISFERVRGDLLISERAENIERNEDIHYKYIKYQLSNKYNPKTMFSIYSIRSMFGLEATIKRID
ncbi:unnamed protein product [Meloidogyne enterolobii]|uniref:Uncharacterized protein n=1 Tax=Meloidogyne enterolobii TaxID=390850 RepID=A0ACB0YN94_MELEN